MPDLAFVNGRITGLEAAVIPIRDRGFLLADGVYEVLRSYDGHLFELEAHLDRLEASLHGIGMRLPMTRRSLRRLLEDLRRRSGHPDARLYIQVTRGVAPRQHAFPRRVRPTLVVYVERVSRRRPAAATDGVGAITLPDSRWGRCDLKTIGLLANVLAKQQAIDAGAHEAIFVGPDGSVREGSSANVFMVRGRELWTHPLGPAILPGVSRAVLLRLARDVGLRVRERRFGCRELYAADEVLLSSTMQEVLPVVRIDDRRIGTGRPGPVAAALGSRFRARTRQEANAASSEKPHTASRRRAARRPPAARRSS